MADKQAKREYDIEYRKNNKEKISEKNKKWYAKTRKERFKENPQHYLWSTARTRARQKGIYFDIEIDDIIIPDTCPITGAVLVKGNGYHPDAMSLDRVINNLGYAKGNVRVISRSANLKKSNLTIAELEQLLKYMRGEI